MKITKFEQSCLLIEMAAPQNRTALFDPGAMSVGVLDVQALEYLDDIIITHEHGDHFSIELITELVKKFPEVRITAPESVVTQLAAENITATANVSEGIVFFDAPHEAVEPLFPLPTEIGVHYLDLFTHPGDSHSFSETKRVLALPVTGPWGSAVKAVNLALELKPEYIVPIHDYHWKPEARQEFYNNFEVLFNKHDITFLKMENGTPVTIDV